MHKQFKIVQIKTAFYTYSDHSLGPLIAYEFQNYQHKEDNKADTSMVELIQHKQCMSIKVLQ